MKEERLEILFHRYIHKKSSEQEEEELMTLLINPAFAQKSKELIEMAYDQLPVTFDMPAELSERIINQVVAKPASVRRIYNPIRRIAVAASVLLVIGYSAYFIISSQKDKPQKTVATNTILQNDVKAPGQSIAMITLSDGTKVPLDSLSSSALSLQNGMNITKTADGQIIYNGNSSTQEYNTLFNPRGSKTISLVLSDGTKLWLNSESSVRYPVAFSDKERRVEITGEAYFEVASVCAKKGGKKIPFIVKSGEVITEVLGTHFNINSYADEASIAVTLLEGAVKVNNGSASSLLSPGQQANLTEGSNIKTTQDVDLDEVMAWKYEMFQFEGKTDIKTIMRQVSRWYNVDVEYRGNVSAHFGGSISRTENISQLFKIMEATDQLKFELVGQKVVVYKALPFKNK